MKIRVKEGNLISYSSTIYGYDDGPIEVEDTAGKSLIADCAAEQITDEEGSTPAEKAKRAESPLPKPEIGVVSK